jgi:hypothetical protein
MNTVIFINAVGIFPDMIYYTRQNDYIIYKLTRLGCILATIVKKYLFNDTTYRAV